jgi:hypothetical protein
VPAAILPVTINGTDFGVIPDTHALLIVETLSIFTYILLTTLIAEAALACIAIIPRRQQRYILLGSAVTNLRSRSFIHMCLVLGS